VAEYLTTDSKCQIELNGTVWGLLYQIQATVGQCKIAVSNTGNIEVRCIKYKQLGGEGRRMEERGDERDANKLL